MIKGVFKKKKNTAGVWIRDGLEEKKKSEYNFYEIFILDTIHWAVILGS